MVETVYICMRNYLKFRAFIFRVKFKNRLDGIVSVVASKNSTLRDIGR